MRALFLILFLCTNTPAFASDSPAERDPIGQSECDTRSCTYRLLGGTRAEQLLSQIDGLLRLQEEISDTEYMEITNSFAITGPYEIVYYHPKEEIRSVIDTLLRERDKPYLVNNREKLNLHIEVLIYSIVQARDLGFNANFSLDSLLAETPARSTYNMGLLNYNIGNLTNHVLSLGVRMANNAGLELWQDSLKMDNLYNGEDISGIGERTRNLYLTSNPFGIQEEEAKQRFEGNILIDRFDPSVIHLRDFTGVIPRELLTDFSLLENLSIGNYNTYELEHGVPQVVFSNELTYRQDSRDTELLGRSSGRRLERLKVVVIVTAYNQTLIDRDPETILDPQTNLYSFSSKFMNNLNEEALNSSEELQAALNSAEAVLLPSPFSALTQSIGMQLSQSAFELSQDTLDTPVEVEISGKKALRGLKVKKRLRLQNLMAGPIYFTDLDSSQNLARVLNQGEGELTVKVSSIGRSSRSSGYFRAEYQFLYSPNTKFFELVQTPDVEIR